MKTVLKSILNAVWWLIIAILLFFVLSGVYQHVVKKDHNTGFFGIGYAVVVSGSMSPMLNEGDFLVYQAQPEDAYEVGDVIIYVRDQGLPDERLISHRIVSIDGETVTAKGDANNLADDPITKDRIVGRMASYVPKIVKAVSFLKTPIGYACISVLIVLLIVLNLIAMRKDRQKKKEK